MIFASSFADALEILQQYGPFCGCLVLAVCFFLWRDLRREGQLFGQIITLQTEQREVLIPMVKNCTDVIARNTVVYERSTTIMERVERKLDAAL